MLEILEIYAVHMEKLCGKWLFFLCRFYFHNWANLFSNPSKFFGVTS